jgi:hypothetical protein
MRTTAHKIIGISGIFLFLWLLLPPIVKVGPALWAQIQILKHEDFDENERNIIKEGIEEGERYYWDRIVPQYSWKTIPSMIFVAIATIALLTDRKIKK